MIIIKNKDNDYWRKLEEQKKKIKPFGLRSIFFAFVTFTILSLSDNFTYIDGLIVGVGILLIGPFYVNFLLNVGSLLRKKLKNRE